MDPMAQYKCGCTSYRDVLDKKLQCVNIRCTIHNELFPYKYRLYMAYCGCWISYPSETRYKWSEKPCSEHEPLQKRFKDLDEELSKKIYELNKKYDTLMKPLEEQCPLLRDYEIDWLQM